VTPNASAPGFRLFGHLEVAGAKPGELGGPKQRALLAYLLLHGGEVVATDRLVDAVWGERPPPTAVAIVHSYVRKLRAALADSPAELVTRAPGYVLELGQEELDLEVFERLAVEGQEALARGDPERARRRLVDALALWRGEPLGDLSDEGFVARERARLDELGLEARLDRIDAELALGRGGSVAELEGLVAEHPFHERARRLLMLALYRSGRQADALAAYRETRRVFADELGLEPSNELRALEHAMLRHDATLEATPRRVAAEPDARTVMPRRRPALLLAVFAASSILLAAGLALETRGGAPGPPKVRRAKILATFDVPQPACCGFGFDAVWALGHHDDILRKIAPRSNRIVGHWAVAGYQSGYPLAAAGSVWIPSAAVDLVRFDPGRQKVLAHIPVQGVSLGFAYLTIWETTQTHQLLRINLHTNRVVKSIRLAPGENNWVDELAIGESAVWIAVADDATLDRIDPLTNAIVARISGFGQTDSGMPIAVDQNAVWVLRFVGGRETLFRVDPTSNRIVARIPVGKPNGAAPSGRVATGGGYVWTGNWDGTLSKVDPRKNRVVAIYGLPAIAQNVSFADGSLWIDSYDASKVWRIDPNG
jgi:DNA-binding SARP family transcriptional activator